MSIGPEWFTSEDHSQHRQAQPSFSVATSNQLWKLSCPDSNLALRDKPTSKTRVIKQVLLAHSGCVVEQYQQSCWKNSIREIDYFSVPIQLGSTMPSNALNTRRPNTCYGANRAIPPATIHQSQMCDPEIPSSQSKRNTLPKKKRQICQCPQSSGAAEQEVPNNRSLQPPTFPPSLQDTAPDPRSCTP